MKRYVLLAGGSGARMAESVLCAACAGVFPQETLEILLVDPDHHGLHSADQLAAQMADYARIQAAAPGEEGGFRTQLNFQAWPEKLPGGAQTISQWTGGSEADALLCQALMDEAAASSDLSRGFNGSRMLGEAVMAALIHQADADDSDALARLTADMAQAIEDGEEVRVVIAGSVCSGTGAAAIPALCRYVQRRAPGARVSAVLLTAVDAAQSAQAAMEALGQYAREGLCGTICVLGLPMSAQPAAPAEYARLTDWLAVYCMDVLLHRPTWLEGVFTVRAPQGPLSWEIFGKAANRYCVKYGRLIKAAAAWSYLIGPEVDKRLRKPSFLRDGLFGWYPHFFRKASCEKDTILADVASLTRLSGVVLLWLGGMMKTLPPELARASYLHKTREESRAHYAALSELAGQLCVMAHDAEKNRHYEDGLVHRHRDEHESEDDLALRRIDAVQQELSRRTAEQQALNRGMGGDALMDMLTQALASAEHDREALQERYREANRRIDHAERIAAEADQYRITDARTKLGRMERHQVMLDGRAERIRQDIAEAQAQQQRFARPQIPAGPAESAMFLPEITERFLRLDPRDRQAVELTWPRLVLPEQSRPLKQTLKSLRSAAVDTGAPAISLMQALMQHSMKDV